MSFDPYRGDQIRENIRVTPLTPEQIERARLYVAGNSRNVEDCRLLLEALGLLPAVETERAA